MSNDISIESSSPISTETEIKPKHRSAWSPVVWLGLGLIVGVGGTAAVLTPRHREAYVAERPAQAPIAKATIPPPSDYDNFVAQNLTGEPKPSVPSSSPFGGKPGDMDARLTGAAAEIFNQPSLTLPKPPAALPIMPPTLKGSIFNGRVPVAPPVSVVPLSPPPSSAISKPLTKDAKPPIAVPNPLEPAKGASNVGYLSSLIASGLPKAPTVLSNSTASAPAVKAASGGRAKLVTVSEVAPDRTASVQTVTGLVQKMGGNVRPLTDNADGKPSVVGMLVTVPEAQLDDFLASVAQSGQIRDRQIWSGSLESRRRKIAEEANAKLDSLKKLREVLVATYLPDSDPVKDTDRDISEATIFAKQFEMTDLADGMAVVRLNFV